VILFVLANKLMTAANAILLQYWWGNICAMLKFVNNAG